MSREQFPGWIVPRSAATSPKVLRSLIPLPGLWGSGRGGGGIRSNQSPSKLAEIPLLLQLETWLSGREDKCWTGVNYIRFQSGSVAARLSGADNEVFVCLVC